MSTDTEILFLASPPPGQAGVVFIDLDDRHPPPVRDGPETLTAHELVSVWAGDAVAWFAGWAGRLNVRNAGLHWWAYSSTSKNLLSSALGTRVVEVLAIRKLARSGQYRQICIRGATPGQMQSISRLLSPEFRVKLPATSFPAITTAISRAIAMLRAIIQAIKIHSGFRLQGARFRPGPRDIVLFTYIDGDFNPQWDRYFGDLPALIARENPGARIACVAYVYTPYRERLHELDGTSAVPYLPLYQFLSTGELLRGLARTIGAAFPRWQPAAADADTAAMDDLLREAFIEDVSRRGYLHNLLVHYAAVNMVRSLSPQTIIYPYENKSLEKTLLLAVRAASPATRLTGYQHTSVTPRHVGLQFSAEESAATPLPDRIVTVGRITRDYLEKTGNYPAGMLVTGCALRQAWVDPLPQQPLPAEAPRVLLALSSSIGELVSAVEFMRRVKTRLPRLQLGVRPHLNFPLQWLPAGLLDWVKNNATDLTGTSLQDNLAWADLTAYVSSTVALESLMLGRPVVYLAIDPGNPDPLLGQPRFRWTAGTADEFLAALSALASLDVQHMAAERDAALVYVHDYLAPKSPRAIATFLQ